MSAAPPDSTHKGGCLCGAVRYQIKGEPVYAGYCCCSSCRKASGSGFVPFLGVAASQLEVTGMTKPFFSTSYRGSPARRNFCAECGSLVHGGEIGVDDSITVYAGTLDDPAWFKPSIAIFTQHLPAWVVLPDNLHRFAAMPEE